MRLTLTTAIVFAIAVAHDLSYILSDLESVSVAVAWTT